MRLTARRITPATLTAGGSARRRLAGVDGLRAAAALWVVLFHIRAFSGAQLSGVPGLDLLLRSGSIGVSLFLVISGFCLYLPFAGGRTHRFDIRTFLLRRCRRLLPAYYASLVAALLLALLTDPALGVTGALWQLTAHVTLIHPLFPGTFFAVNGAYWSLGLEWQLYLGLVVLVLGVRRFGLAWTTGAVLCVNVVYRLLLSAALDHHLLAVDRVTATAVLPNQLPGRWGEFALGMVAAELYVTGRVPRAGRHLTWAVAPLIGASLLAVGQPLSHILFGGVFMVLLMAVLAGDNVISRALSWAPLVGLGTMSYSLYLVHQPIIDGIAHLMRVRLGATPMQTFWVLMLLTPLILVVAWVLFVTVERRTLTPVSRGGWAAAAPQGEAARTDVGGVAQMPRSVPRCPETWVMVAAHGDLSPSPAAQRSSLDSVKPHL